MSLLQTLIHPPIIFGSIFLFFTTLTISILFSVNSSKLIKHMNSVPLAICRIRDDGTIVFINSKLKELLHNYEIPLFNTIDDVANVINFDLDKFHEVVNEIKTSHLNKYSTEKVFNFDGKKIYFIINLIRVEKHKGHYYLTFTIIENTKYKVLETSYEEKEKFISSILNNAPMSINFKDVNGVFRYVSNQCANFFKISSPNSIIGKTIYELMDLYTAEMIEEKRLECIQEQRKTTLELAYDNFILRIEHYPYVLHDDIKGTICTITDITNDYLMKQQLQEKIEIQDKLHTIQRILLNVTPTNFNNQIYTTLNHISDFLSSEIAYFFRINEYNKRDMMYEYKKSWVSSYVDNIKDAKVEDSFLKVLNKTSVFKINNSSELKNKTYKFFDELEIISVLEVVLVSKNFKGILGVCNRTTPKTWTKEAETFLKIVGDSLLNVFDKLDNINKYMTSEKRFKLLTENFTDMIMRFDAQGRHVYANPAVKELLPPGMEIKDVVGKTHRELGFSSSTSRIFEKLIDETFKNGEVNRMEFQLPNGKWVDAIGMPEYGKNGSIQYVITSARDITRMKESEQELMEINQTFETLTNNSPLGIIIFDLEKENRKDNIYYANKKAEITLGFSKDELNTIVLEDYLYNTKDEENFQYLIKHKDSPERRSKLLRFRTKYNKLKILEVELTSIDVETTVYTLFTFIDVTKYYKHIYNK